MIVYGAFRQPLETQCLITSLDYIEVSIYTVMCKPYKSHKNNIQSECYVGE